ncbi:arylsulfatase A-like enzyme [Maribacter vaceletii]|uniref:Arylsulfatase A-like enzyme n=1 Tax=Maribacter vaceletii TaxID=1206816 RepID=A0A495DTV8_9FLAO|nr:sulfatase-like hydrolase/transferase [Maribacter vaceletii]RKR08052.1 arylsulfatase A-like enzyme [Maribacter vaceletii]
MKNIVILLNNIKKLFFAIIIVTIYSCSTDKVTNEVDVDTDNTDSNENTPNILLIIADDIGKDAINGFSEGNIKPNTPNIDAIRNSGLSFTNFWAYPTCSPTRATILTGKYGYHTGVKWAGDELDLSEKSLQKYINEETNNKYSTALVGKWHLSGSNSSFNPEVYGIDYFSGLIRGEAQSYYNWLLTEDGTGNLENEYTTKKFTDVAIDWISKQNKPWFMWLAHNAPHTPFHAPPVEMHNQGNLPDYEEGMDAMPYFMAAIEALDFQIGRLLESIPTDERENTVIIFLGDNGTPNEVAQEPYLGSTAKGSLHQGGVNVPLFISGKGVSRTGDINNLITSTDLFATIAEIAGISVSEINDSKSFKPLFTQDAAIRNFQYAESNNRKEAWVISNGSYKLFENVDGDKEFFILDNDPYENNNLLNGVLTTNETNAKLGLEAQLLEIRK